jgi:predicted transcriptional regulator
LDILLNGHLSGAIYGTLHGVTKTTVYLDSDTVLALRQMAETQGRSQAELIRDALQNYTRAAKRPLPRGLGKYDSGEIHGAEHAKDFLRSAAKKGRWRQ